MQSAGRCLTSSGSFAHGPESALKTWAAALLVGGVGTARAAPRAPNCSSIGRRRVGGVSAACRRSRPLPADRLGGSATPGRACPACWPLTASIPTGWSGRFCAPTSSPARSRAAPWCRKTPVTTDCSRWVVGGVAARVGAATLARMGTNLTTLRSLRRRGYLSASSNRTMSPCAPTFPAAVRKTRSGCSAVPASSARCTAAARC